MHKQIQIAPGVYITDFRKDKNIVGLTEQRKQLTNDVGLLLDQVQTLQSKINQLQYSIKQIQQEQNWEKDPDFLQAIDENWRCIVKFSYEMKEKVLRLFQLQYHPQSQKIQQLLKISRIEDREQKAIQQVKKQIINNKKQQENQKQNKLAKVQDSDQEQKQSKRQQKKEPNTKQQKKPQKQEEQDKGVFI